MNIKVSLFSVLRDAIGEDSLQVAVHDGATGTALLDRLCAEYPGVAPYRTLIRLAVNETYSSEEVALADGDHVALITPVSGG